MRLLSQKKINEKACALHGLLLDKSKTVFARADAGEPLVHDIKNLKDAIVIMEELEANRKAKAVKG